MALIFSKYLYLVSLNSYYTFYLMSKFHVSVRTAQLHLFVFLAAVAAGTVLGGPIGDRVGRKYVIWCWILGVFPFTLILPYAGLFWTAVLSVIIGVVLAGIIWLVIPTSFSESKGPATASKVDEAALAHMPTNLWNHNVIMGFIGCVILGISLYGFLGLYTTFATSMLKFARPDVALAFSFFGLGGIMSFVGGWCGDRFPQRWVIACAYVCFAVVTYSMYNVATAITAQCFLTWCIGCFGSGFVFTNLLSMLQRSVRPSMVGRASGIFIASLFGAASIAGYSMGALVGRFGWGTAALLQLTLLPVIGIIAMSLVDPTKLIVANPKKA